MSDLSERVAREHQRVWSLLAVTCQCGWSWTKPEDNQVPFTTHIVEITKAEVQKALAEQMSAKAALLRATRDEMLRAILAREPHDFTGDDTTRYAAYAQAWESAARMARGES